MSETETKKMSDSKKRDMAGDTADPAKDTATVTKKSRTATSKADVMKDVLPDAAPLVTVVSPLALSMESSECRQIYNNVVANSKGDPRCLQTDNSPSTFILAMVTNNVPRMSKMNQEKNAVFTIINYIPIKVLDNIGYHKAPYEKAEGANPKQMVFFDKKGKIIPGTLSSTLATSVMVDGSKCLDWRTWNPHPTAMMKNKWRGLPTDVVGSICPGVPLSNFIFDEQKENIMHDCNTEEALTPFSLAVIGIVVRSNEQCERGYGISIKSIRHVGSMNASMSGLYDKKWFYNDNSDINGQTLDLLAKASRSKVYSSDLKFVSKLIRGSTDEKVTERPVVYIDLKNERCKNHSHKIHVHPNNQTLELEFVCEGSIYDNKRFKISIPTRAFTMEQTGIAWVQSYYQWCLDANLADIVIIHDEYQLQKFSDGGNHSYVDCCIIPDEIGIFSRENRQMLLSAEIQTNLRVPSDPRFQSINISGDNIKDFAGTTIFTNPVSNVSHSIVIDRSRIRIPKDKDTTEETDVTDTDSKESGWKNHTSAVCRLYSGMESDRHIWCAYLLVHEGSKIISVLPVGIQANKPAGPASVLQSPAGVDIYANPNVFLE